MAQVQYIKHLYEKEELSLREISRRTGHCFETVQKYASRTDWNEEEKPNTEPERYPVLGNYIPVIDEWLEDDLKAPRKQRHTIKRIYDRLCKEYGFTGSYGSVKKYVNRKRPLLKKSYEEAGSLPLEHATGAGQVDFGEFSYYDESGAEHAAYALTISFPFSNMGFTQVFPSQNQECLLEGMKRIFEHIGGVPPVLRFDNMSTAVAHVGEGQERELTEGFSRFMLHYRFQAEFCNRAAGNEKGHVENKVGYSRRNAFVPVPVIKSFEEFNESLWGWCEEDGERLHYKRQVLIAELWKEDKKHLLHLPENPFLVFRYITCSVRKDGFVQVDKNRYGISPELAGKKVQAKVFFDHLEIYYEHVLVGEYRRSYGKNEEVMDWTYYLATLCRKPGGLEYTRFYEQIPDRWRGYLTELKGQNRKSALQLLNEIVSEGNVSLCEDVLELADENGRKDVDSLRQYYYLIAKKEYRPTPLLFDSDPGLHYEPDLSAYDGLMGGGVTDV